MITPIATVIIQSCGQSGFDPAREWSPRNVLGIGTWTSQEGCPWVLVVGLAVPIVASGLGLL